MAAVMSGRDRVLLLALTAYVAGGFVLAPLPCTLGFGASVMLLRGHRVVTPRGAAVLIVMFCALAARGLVARAEAHRTYDSAVALASPPAHCEIEAIVIASPQARQESERTKIEATGGRCADRAIPPGTRFDLRTHTFGLARGDRVVAEGKFAPVSLFDNPGSIPAWTRLARTRTALSGTAQSVTVRERGANVASLVDHARAHVRARIRETYHAEAESLGRALVLGETDLDADVSDAFRTTGLSHILAVSGTHLVVAVLALTGALRAILLGWMRVSQRVDTRRIASALAIPIAWLYADFAGGSGSVVRAAAMLTAILAAQVLERRPSPSRSLAAAMLVGVAMDPLVIADVSFTLSTAATCGLLILARPIAALLGAKAPSAEEVSLPRRAWSALATAMATTLGATIACAPVTALLSPELPIAGVAANLVAAPLGEVFALPFALAHAMLSPIAPLELGAARAASGALRAVLWIARVARDAGATLPVPSTTAYHLLAVGVGATWMACARGGARWLSVLGLLVCVTTVEISVRHGSRPKGVLTVTALDVGQGDAILVDLPDGSVMLVDAGGVPTGGGGAKGKGQAFDLGQRVIAPVLRARRRAGIDYVVLSHPHPDHYLGLPTTLEKAEYVGELWHNGYEEDDGRSKDVAAIVDRARQKGARIFDAATLCQGPRDVGGAVIEVLAPCPSIEPWLSINDGSLVIKITFGERSVLLMGDAEEEAEHRLLADRPDALRADLLKVGHHGSRTSTTLRFARAVAPTHAVISCGIRNRFGHPNRETLETLHEIGAEVARTDLTGAWSWSTDGHDVWVSE